MPLLRSWAFSRRYRNSCRDRRRRRLPWGKAAFPQLIQCLNFDDCMERSHEVKRYDVFIRMQPAHKALPARSFLLYQGTVRSNVSLAALCRAFVRFCPNVDWVVDIAVADHM